MSAPIGDMICDRPLYRNSLPEAYNMITTGNHAYHRLMLSVTCLQLIARGYRGCNRPTIIVRLRNIVRSLRKVFDVH